MVLRRVTGDKIKLPPLAAGIGVYLPAAVTTMLVIGAVCGWIYDRWIKTTRFADVGRRMGVLLASGLIVGESLFGVFTAAVIVSTKNEAPFALLPADTAWPAMIAGFVAFAALTFALYAWVRRRSAKV
ncbi:oligopeptide transporter, OPT family [compost metagenome]